MKAFVYSSPVDDWRILIAAHDRDQAEHLIREEWDTLIERPTIIDEVTDLNQIARDLLGLPEAMPSQLESAPYWERRLEFVRSVSIGQTTDPEMRATARLRADIDEAETRLDQTRHPFTAGELLAKTAFPTIINESGSWDEDPGLSGTLYLQPHPFGPVCCPDKEIYFDAICNQAALQGARPTADEAVSALARATAGLGSDPANPAILGEAMFALCQVAYASDLDLAVALKRRLLEILRHRRGAAQPESTAA